MKPIRTALLCAAVLFGWGVPGFARGGIQGIQQGFGLRRNEAGGRQNTQRSVGTPGMQRGGFGGLPGTGGFGGFGGFGNQPGGQRPAIGTPGVQRGPGGPQGQQQSGRGGQPRGNQGGGTRQGGYGGEQRNQQPAGPTTRPGGNPGGNGTVRTGGARLKRPFGAGQYDTSAFMAGEIHVNVVLFESDGRIDPDTENWSKAEIDKVVAHVRKACAWWEEMWKKKNYAGSLHFTVDLEHANTPFRTSYEPITHRAYQDDRLWIGEFLNSLGYSGDKTTMLYQFTADTIEKHNADFAFNIFVVKADNDRDHYFSDSYRSYTLGRRYDGVSDTYILTAYSKSYDWYSSQSFAHEMAHIFGAADEYPGQGNYNDRAGYYGVQNTNAPDGNPDRNRIVPSLMNSSISSAFERRTTSPQSLEMVGWRDSDGDGVIDVLDAPIEVTDFSSKLNLSDSTYDFTGTFTVRKVPNFNNTKAVTINSVDRLLYRYGESGEWKSDNGKDWNEESRTVSRQFKIPAGSVLQWKVADSDGTAESKTYTIGNVRNPKVNVNRETGSASFSFTPATADAGIVRYKLRVDDKTFELAEGKNSHTLSGLSSGRHTWAIQGVYADSSATDWLSCGAFTVTAGLK